MEEYRDKFWELRLLLMGETALESSLNWLFWEVSRLSKEQLGDFRCAM